MRAGLTHAEFWDLTQGEVYDRIEVWHWQQREIRTQELKLQAWLIESLRDRKLPPLDQYLYPKETTEALEGEELERRRREHEELARLMSNGR